MSAIIEQDSFEPLRELPERSLSDYLALFRRRARTVGITAGCILTVALLLAVFVPPTYRSSATVLIQEQEIPPELVRSTITSFADERIQVISQQVLARSVLLQLIEKYDLYARQRRFTTNEEILDRMRSDIKLSPISAEVQDRRTGSQVKATIAFKVSYDSDSADKAQKIANELATLFLNENTKNREERAAETSSFLEAESERVSSHIAEVEAKLSSFKERNQGRLPELRELNLAVSERTDNELLRVEHDLSENTHHLAALQSELALTSPYSTLPTDSGKEVVLQPEEELKAAKAQLAALEGTYTDDHPDIRRLKRKIASLEGQGYGLDLDDDTEKRLTVLNSKLTELRQKYSEDFPDVIKVKREIATLEALPTKPAPSAAPKRVRADNPVYLNLRSQIDAANAQLTALTAERLELVKRQSDLQRRLEQTPEVEREYLELSRDQENSRTRYRELKEKQMEAEVAEQLERGRKGERFTLIEPPQYPERPASPNRLLILTVGFILSIAGGMSAGAIHEAIDDTVIDAADLARILHVPNLSVIPLVELDEALELRKRRRLVLAVAAFAALLLLIVIVHFLVTPLDVIWYSFQRRLGI